MGGPVNPRNWAKVPAGTPLPPPRRRAGEKRRKPLAIPYEVYQETEEKHRVRQERRQQGGDQQERKGPIGAAAGVAGAAIKGAGGPSPQGFSSTPARGRRRVVSVDQFIAGQQSLQDNPLPGPVRATHQRALKTLSTVGQAFPTTENPAGGGSTVNRHILIAVVVITAVGALAAARAKRPVTRVVVGGIVLLIVLSILDAFGGPLSTVAGSLATLAMVVVLLVELPALLPILQTLPDPASLPAGTPPGGGGSKGVK